jgi:hypothetical protein
MCSPEYAFVIAMGSTTFGIVIGFFIALMPGLMEKWYRSRS